MGQIRKMALVALTLAISAISLSSAPVVTAAIARISVVPGLNSSVTQITEPDSEGNRYLAGAFTAFDSWGTGGGALVDNLNGTVNTSFPAVTGYVLASAGDGSGGFYIGGNFTAVGGVLRNNLAHISSDGSLDTDWNPAANNTVNAIAVSDNTVYLGGYFTAVGGTTRNFVAAVNNTTGAATTWDPNVNDAVLAIAVSDNTVYLGGAFTAIGTGASLKTRNRVAAVNNTTGAATTWDPNTDGTVNTIAVSDNTVYLGGAFTAVGGTTRNFVAAVNNTTGAATSWDPGANNSVSTITVSGDTVYLGGYFTAVGGTTRNNVAAVNNTTGAATTWDPNANYPVYTIAVSGSTLYLGGYFTTIGGTTRNFVAAINTDGMLNTWNPNVNAWVNTIAMSGDTVYLGGAFTAIGATPRNHVAAVNNTTGAATSWDPGANNSVSTITVSGDTVYLGGYFTAIGTYPDQVTRNHVAAVKTDGTVTDWNPAANNTVNAIAVSDNTVYLGGRFTAIGSGPSLATRNRVAAVNNTTGAVTTWDPNVNDAVLAIAVSDGVVYLGGYFTTIGTEESPRAQNFGAAVNTDGISVEWNPNADAYLSVIVVSGNTAYIGGEFTSIGGESHNYIVAIDVRTGLVISLQLPPATPTTPVATALDGKVTVSVNKGTAVAGTPSSFTVSAVQDETKTCTVTGSSGSCTVSSLANGTSYTFAAIASNAGGSSSTSASSIAVTPTAVATTTVPTAVATTTVPTATTTTVPAVTTTIPAVTTTTVPKAITPSVKKGKAISFTTIYKSAKIQIPKGATVVLTVAKSSKSKCSVVKTTVKALAVGTCSLTVAVTPRATTKVKKPKTVVTKTKVIVTK